MYYLHSRYYDPEVCRFINADDAECLGAEGDLLSYNLFAYCLNNPVNRTDVNGNWSLPNWAKKTIAAVAVVAVVAAVAAVTVATAGAGTAAAVIAIGAAKGAAVGMVSGAVIGAGTSAIKHRVQTGSWSGAGEAALNGMGDGALSGAITGAITGAASSGFKVARAANSWGSAGGRTPFQNMSSHFEKHVINEGHTYLGNNVIEYTNNASQFFSTNQGVMRLTKSGNYAIRAVFNGNKAGGFFSSSGTIFSFF